LNGAVLPETPSYILPIYAIAHQEESGSRGNHAFVSIMPTIQQLHLIFSNRGYIHHRQPLNNAHQESSTLMPPKIKYQNAKPKSK
jgi:hypothetical protein